MTLTMEENGANVLLRYFDLLELIVQRTLKYSYGHDGKDYIPMNRPVPL